MSGVSITINGNGINVRLRNLAINGLGSNFTGVDYVNGNALFIENCRIYFFTAGNANGIRFRPSSGSHQLYIADTIIEGNGTGTTGGGVFIQPTGSASVRAVITDTKVQCNVNGILADGTGGSGSIVLQLRESSIAGNSGAGLWVKRAGVVVDKITSVNNTGFGILADGAGSVVHVGGSTIAGNGGGMSAQNSSQIFSYGNNQAKGNGFDGGPTGSLAPN